MNAGTILILALLGAAACAAWLIRSLRVTPRADLDRTLQVEAASRELWRTHLPKLTVLAIILFVIASGVWIFGGKAPAPSAAPPVPAAPAPPAPQPTYFVFAQRSTSLRAAASEASKSLRRATRGEKLEVSGPEGDFLALKAGGFVLTAAVEADPPEVVEARKREEAESKRRAEKLVADSEINRRRNYAATLRETMLDRGSDMKVSVSGSKADRLRLEFVLFNAVWEHRFRKDGVVDQWREMGFRRVDMTDGYDYHVYWDWK